MTDYGGRSVAGPHSAERTGAPVRKRDERAGTGQAVGHGHGSAILETRQRQRWPSHSTKGMLARIDHYNAEET